MAEQLMKTTTLGNLRARLQQRISDARARRLARRNEKAHATAPDSMLQDEWQYGLRALLSKQCQF